ncbi:ABC transporter ATP-binding protein [Nocardioides sp.]|uniref:ABC transporter ATP-binding protein n=1 Tax=Nocardioides sp. TaxID=35761 RepID=UPI003565AF39
MTRLEIDAVNKSFGDVHAVDSVDLVVPEESMTAVLGPSGCGKTTLLRLVAGFLVPDSGTIRFGETIVAGAGRVVPPQRRKVGYVPQEGALFPHLDVAANIGFGLPRARRRSARIGQMLDLVELPAHYAERFPHELSGGQQQRVALARALAPEPQVVLLDEPFSSLDASLRIATGHAVVRALRAARATAVLVTHDQDEALSLADQVAVMRRGRVVQAAPPRDVYRSPVDIEVARFVGGAAVLPATIRAGRAVTALGEVAVTSAVKDGAAEVLIRPEQVLLGAEGSGVKAHVDSVGYYGHDASVTLTLLPDGPTLAARVNGLDVPATGATVAITVAGPVVAFQ